MKNMAQMEKRRRAERLWKPWRMTIWDPRLDLPCPQHPSVGMLSSALRTLYSLSGSEVVAVTQLGHGPPLWRDGFWLLLRQETQTSDSVLHH